MAGNAVAASIAAEKAADQHILTPKPAPARLYGLESLRFVLAIWVALGHGAWLSLPDAFDVHSGLPRAAATLPAFMFCGTFAVAIFFLLSGLCIHFPNVDKANPPWGKFLLGRAIRIGIPLVFVLAVCAALGRNYLMSLDAVAWSVYCEIVYYLLYPVLFTALRKRPTALLVGSLCISAAILATNLDKLRLWEFGPLTWLFCYPMWIAGALLAAKLRAIGIPGPAKLIWLWRGAAVCACVLAVAAISQARPPIGYTVTIVPFAVFSYFWLLKEIGTLAERRPPALLEHLGHASYTLYLVHRPAMTAVENLFPQLVLEPGAPAVATWLLKCFAIAGSTAAVYLLVERPSHHLGRRLSKLQPKTSVAASCNVM